MSKWQARGNPAHSVCLNQNQRWNGSFSSAIMYCIKRWIIMQGQTHYWSVSLPAAALSTPECNVVTASIFVFILTVACEIQRPLNRIYWTWHIVAVLLLLFLFDECEGSTLLLLPSKSTHLHHRGSWWKSVRMEEIRHTLCLLDWSLISCYRSFTLLHFLTQHCITWHPLPLLFVPPPYPPHIPPTVPLPCSLSSTPPPAQSPAACPSSLLSLSPP